MKEIEIKSENRFDKGELIITSNKTKIFIGTLELDAYYKYLSLSASDKIELFKISLTDLEGYLNAQIKKQKKKILELLSDTWYERETGEIADLNSYVDYINIGFNKNELIKKCKGRSKLSERQVESIFEFFIGEKSEIYRNNE